MNNIIKQTNDVTILQSGEAFISQRKLAVLCGVDQSTINRYYASLNIDVNQGISDENAVLCITYYAIESKAANDTARKSLAIIAKAGMRAYLYHEAGYVLGTQNSNPNSISEILERAERELKALEKEMEGSEISFHQWIDYLTDSYTKYKTSCACKKFDIRKNAEKELKKEIHKVFASHTPIDFPKMLSFERTLELSALARSLKLPSFITKVDE